MAEVPTPSMLGSVESALRVAVVSVIHAALLTTCFRYADVCAGEAAPVAEVPTPSMLGSAESAALAAGLFVADFVTHFADTLDIEEPPGFSHLHVRCPASVWMIMHAVQTGITSVQLIC